MMNILQACADKNLFGQWFKKRETWEMWFAFLAALFALPMDEAQIATYRKHTGRMALPQQPFSEASLVVGRRGGKSFVLALSPCIWRPSANTNNISNRESALHPRYRC